MIPVWEGFGYVLAEAMAIQQIQRPTAEELLKEAVVRFDKDKIAAEYLQVCKNAFDA